ncbi:MAG: conjugal transfer protein TraU [gamma proteobacterium symbiont of Clathrolucina costata]
MKRGGIVLSALLLMTSNVSADPGCQNAEIISGKMITDVCWDCIFPLTIAGKTMASGSSSAPSQAVTDPLCICHDDLGVPHPGITTSMWEPARLVEFQRVPGCSSVLNGAMFPFDRLNQGHHQRGGKQGAQGTFMHYHYYSFPLLSIMDMFTNPGCSADGYMDLDMMYMSEIDPTWNNDELAFFSNPEAAAVANPLAAAACPADAASSTAGNPIDSLFWCAGTWGLVYPLSGNQYTMSSVVKNTSLLKVKVLAALHRRGLAHRTMGQDAMCEGMIDVTYSKEMYKYTLMYPLPETDEAHVTGESTFSWGMGRTIPAVGQDLIYMIWRWNDCCNISAN